MDVLIDTETRRCTNCGGLLHKLSVDGSVEYESVSAALIDASPGDLVRFHAVCEDCDHVTERYVQVEPMYQDCSCWHMGPEV
jgi:hypothetical protein